MYIISSFHFEEWLYSIKDVVPHRWSSTCWRSDGQLARVPSKRSLSLSELLAWWPGKGARHSIEHAIEVCRCKHGGECTTLENGCSSLPRPPVGGSLRIFYANKAFPNLEGFLGVVGWCSAEAVGEEERTIEGRVTHSRHYGHPLQTLRNR